MTYNKEAMKKYRKTKKGKEAMKRGHQKYYQKNKEKELLHKKEYYLKNRDEILKYKKEHYLKNREKILNYKKENWDNVYKQKKEYFIAKTDGRRRKINWIKMFDNPFNKSEKIEWHHINNCYVVAIPEDIHKLYYGISIKQHRELVMNVAKQIYLKENE